MAGARGCGPMTANNIFPAGRRSPATNSSSELVHEAAPPAARIASLAATFRASDAAVLRGTLTVPSAPPAAHHMNAYPGHADAMPSHSMALRGAVNDAVLWIERIPCRAESALAAAPAGLRQLAQKDQCFMPRVVSVAAGGSAWTSEPGTRSTTTSSASRPRGGSTSASTRRQVAQRRVPEGRARERVLRHPLRTWRRS